MLNTNNLVPGNLTRSRTAFALIAATLLVGGSISEASAKSRHHRHHSHHASKAQAAGGSWLDSNASIGSQSSGRGFAGKASYSANESGIRTAPCYPFRHNAMT